MNEFLGSVAVFLAIIVVWALRVEMRGRRQREAMRSWFAQNVPDEEIPEHLK